MEYRPEVDDDRLTDHRLSAAYTAPSSGETSHGAGAGSHLTHRWRKVDSNLRSPGYGEPSGRAWGGPRRPAWGIDALLGGGAVRRDW